MPKTIKGSFYKKLTFENMLKAHERSLKNKSLKKDVLKFNIDLETNLWNIINSLKDGKYKVGNYRTFIVHEPKERTIKSLPYTDRVVQQWYVYEFIKPYYMKRFINDTCACIDLRGTHYALRKTQKYMRMMKKENGNYYVLKCDVKSFFYSIDKDILFKMMTNVISDKKLLDLTHQLIYEGEGTGIPIGNYTSQYFANIYLDGLDHYIKEDLKIKYYVRYMDDFILLVKDKKVAAVLMQKIAFFLNQELKLKLNSKSRYYPSKLGINFCGYIIFETHILLRKSAKRKLNKMIDFWDKLNKSGRLNKNKMLLQLNSFKAHSKHANSYKLMSKKKNDIENIFFNN